MKLTMEQRVAFYKKYEPHFEAYKEFALADLHLPYKVKLTFDTSPCTYTDNTVINIGLENVDVESEEEFLMMVDYLIGHEVQHIRSTPNKIWIWAQKRGAEVILESASRSLEKRPRLFRKDNDYELFLRYLLETHGYRISVGTLQRFVHAIKNSLEDGRIERIRSSKRKNFKDKVAVVRGRLWKENPCNKKDIKTMSDADKLITIMNQILSLSTTSLYQQDFKKYYGGTELEEICEKIVPHISAGVSAIDCKTCMDEAIKIIDILAMPILKASKISDLEELLRKLISQALEGKYGDYGAEETNDAPAGAPLGISELSIDLPEDEEKKAEKGSGIKTSSKQDKDDNPNGTSQEESSNSKDEGSGSSDEGEDADKNESSDDSENESKSTNTGGCGKSKGSSDQKSSAVGETKEEELADIEKAVKEAMEKASLQEQSIADAIKRAADPPKKASKPMSNIPQPSGTGENVAGNPKAANVRKLYGENVRFKEYTRSYSVDVPLPYWLKGKSDVFSKKIDEVLKNQYKPAIRCRKTGKVDGMMIHKLAMNQTDIFIKPARTDKFSGCCYILVDNSGSMGCGEESKREYAWNAIAEIEAGYSKLMPLKIVAFDTHGTVCHEIVKDWQEVLKHSGAFNFMVKGRDGGGNMDGYSISVATDEILRQSGNKKLLIVLSDGAPDSYEKTKQAILYARKNGVILVGIYFSEVGETPSQREIERFESMYGTDGYAICTSPENISSELYKVMKREFLS